MDPINIKVDLEDLGDEIYINPATIPVRDDDMGHRSFVIVSLGTSRSLSLVGTPEELLALAERLRDAAHTVELARMDVEVAR